MSDETTQRVKRGAAYWQNLLDTELAGSDAFFIFPKEGKTRLRLLPPAVGEDWRRVDTVFRGRQKKKYLMLAINPQEEEPTVKAVVLAKTAFDGVVKLLAEGFDLIDPEEGHGITIIRTGSGLNTSYSVLPSRSPVVVKPEWLKQTSEKNLDELADQYEKRSQQRQQGGAQQTTETAAASQEETRSALDTEGAGEYDEGSEDW